MKLKNIFLSILAAGLLVSCYDDESSEGRLEKLNIQVQGIEQNIRVNTSELLQLRPEVTPADRDYRYFWGIAKKDNQWSIIDTLSYEKDFDYKVDLKTGGYLLRFCAQDVETGIYSYTEYNLSVETDMAVGWWVLKDDGTHTDIDLFTPEKTKENVIKTVNGRSLAGKAVDLNYTPNYWVYDVNQETDLKTNAVFIASGQDLVCLDYFTGKFLGEYEDLFFDAPQLNQIDQLFHGASDTHVVVNGEVYTMPNMKYDHYRQFAIKHTGDYQLSKYRNANGWGFPFLFDEKSSSFCTVTRNSLDLDYLGNNTGYPHRNLDMDLLYLGAYSPNGTYSPGQDAYAILKKKTEDKYYLAHLTGALSTGRSPMKEPMVEIPSNFEVLKASVKTLNPDNGIIYFFKGSQLYAYDCIMNTETMEDFQLGAGEEATYMEYTKYNPWGQEPYHFKYMLIATHKGDSYKVSLHPVQAGHLRAAEKTMEGKGTVKRAVYMDMKNGIVNTSSYF